LALLLFFGVQTILGAEGSKETVEEEEEDAKVAVAGMQVRTYSHLPLAPVIDPSDTPLTPPSPPSHPPLTLLSPPSHPPLTAL